MSVIDTRRQQMFPVLDVGQMETASRFASGPARDFAPNEIVFEVGERQAPSWLVLKGSINTVRRDGLRGIFPASSASSRGASRSPRAALAPMVAPRFPSTRRMCAR